MYLLKFGQDPLHFINEKLLFIKKEDVFDYLLRTEDNFHLLIQRAPSIVLVIISVIGKTCQSTESLVNWMEFSIR